MTFGMPFLLETATVEEAAADLLSAGVGTVVIKCGAKGCYIRNQEQELWVAPEERVTCVDTTGAGDSFAAGFIKEISENKTVEEAIETANECGSRSCEYIGTTTWLEHI